MREDVTLRFGKGLISGYLAAFLGILSLCGVLCFRFPSLLTSEQFRTAYTQDFARNLLFWALVAAYFLGIISYALNRSKVLAWIGIGTAFTASLLGGSRIEIQPFESTPYSFGLDWFAISFLFSMLIFIPIEKAFALHKEQKLLRKGWRLDLTYFFVSHLLIQFVFLWTNLFAATAFGWAATEGLQSSIRSLPIWAQFILATFLADVFQYWSHRVHHKFGFLWKFHSVHHSSHSMDWLAGSRTHLIEVFVTRGFVMVPLYVCGFSEPALNAYVILVGGCRPSRSTPMSGSILDSSVTSSPRPNSTIGTTPRIRSTVMPTTQCIYPSSICSSAPTVVPKANGPKPMAWSAVNRHPLFSANSHIRLSANAAKRRKRKRLNPRPQVLRLLVSFKERNPQAIPSIEGSVELRAHT